MKPDVNMNVVRRNEETLKKIRFDVAGFFQEIFVIFNSAEVFRNAPHVEKPHEIGKERHDPVDQKTEPKVEHNTGDQDCGIKSEPKVLYEIGNFRRLVDVGEYFDGVEP